ncbi:hypothetical protein E2C01_008358 [Portunus trituberculatus]|uniref:Uncharacterized protein n=1 Tax=Portunus trituberculatus TaxID=210409 RepID=A0A5B7D0K3_PORTR|nr:hypothetical protein [Portunus trituberculatus]
MTQSPTKPYRPSTGGLRSDHITDATWGGGEGVEWRDRCGARRRRGKARAGQTGGLAPLPRQYKDFLFPKSHCLKVATRGFLNTRVAKTDIKPILHFLLIQQEGWLLSSVCSLAFRAVVNVYPLSRHTEPTMISS